MKKSSDSSFKLFQNKAAFPFWGLWENSMDTTIFKVTEKKRSIDI